MNRIDVDYDTTLAALENGLRVRHVAEFGLRTCEADQPVAEVLGDLALAGFDQFPVRSGSTIVGVLERPPIQGGVPCGNDDRLAGTAMRPLDSAMLVADSHPVGALLETLDGGRYRPVVRSGEVAGIVTPSDFLKLPVRLYAFMLITHLEMAMAAAIRRRFPAGDPDAWLSLLSPDRQTKVRDKLAEHAQQRLDPDPIEFTDFCDKRAILRRFHHSKRAFERDLKQIEELRNALVHAGAYLQGRNDLDDFLRRVRLTNTHIAELRQPPLAHPALDGHGTQHVVAGTEAGRRRQ